VFYLPAEEGIATRVCAGGARHRPPEDVGGVIFRRKKIRAG